LCLLCSVLKDVLQGELHNSGVSCTSDLPESLRGAEVSAYAAGATSGDGCAGCIQGAAGPEAIRNVVSFGAKLYPLAFFDWKCARERHIE